MKNNEVAISLREDLFRVVRSEVDSSSRKEYEKKIAKADKLYECKRSVRGIEEKGKLKYPWPGCADVGTPIEITIIQELIPNVMNAHLGQKPATETQILTKKGYEPYGHVDDFIYDGVIEDCNLRAIRRKTVLSGYKYSEGIEKVVLSKITRRVRESRLYLVTSKDKNKRKFLMADDGPLEVTEEETIDLVIARILSQRDVRSTYFMYCQQELQMPAELAAQACGMEKIGDDKLKVTQFIPQIAQTVMSGQGQMAVPPDGFPEGATEEQQKMMVEMALAPMIPLNPKETDTYFIDEVDVDEPVVIRQGIEVVRVPTKDFLWPSNATTNDVMKLKWCGHRYNETLNWLESVKDMPEFSKDAVEAVMRQFSHDRIIKEMSTETTNRMSNMHGGGDDRNGPFPQIWEIYASWPLKKGDSWETEIIVWFCPDATDPLLGWTPNPAAVFECEHIRPFFVFQPKPENDKFSGLSVPESGESIRKTIDWLLNASLNREELYGNPRRKMSPSVLARPANMRYGPGCVSVVLPGDIDEYANPPIRQEGFSVNEQELLVQRLRLMWGASEYFSGQAAITESKTFGEAQMLSQLGGKMFMDTVESFCQVADKQYEYIKNLIYHSPEASSYLFEVRNHNLKYTRSMLGPEVRIRARRPITETERFEKMNGIKMYIELMMRINPELVKHPQFEADVDKALKDLLNIEFLGNYSAKEISQAQAQVLYLQQQQKAQDRVMKQLERVQNGGARAQIEAFLKQSGIYPTQRPEEEVFSNANLQASDVIGGL